MRHLLFVAAVMIGDACGGSSGSVPVKGSDVDIGLMAGRWEGTYEGTDSGRRGTVMLDLALGHHSAEGQVIMHAAGTPPGGQPLQIRFVEMKRGEVSGKLGPYTDPGCRCAVETEFIGTVKGGTIEGSFTTRAVDSGQVQVGSWQAVRTEK